MRKKIILTISFIVTILPMLLNWFGTIDGKFLISGTEVLFNPIIVISIIVYFLFVWYKGDIKLCKILPIISLFIIFIYEIYEYFNYMIVNIDAQRVVYLGYFISVIFIALMITLYIKINKKDIKIS